LWPDSSISELKISFCRTGFSILKSCSECVNAKRDVATYRGRIPLHHADLYRIADEDELYGTGFGDLVGGEGALLVEWADRIPSALPAERLTVRLAHDARAPNVRHVEVEGLGERHAALARTLVARARRSRPAPGAAPKRATRR
jgi:tRNA threonylcarbamoyladenosine biosynthesis protein TsaE